MKGVREIANFIASPIIAFYVIHKYNNIGWHSVDFIFEYTITPIIIMYGWNFISAKEVKQRGRKWYIIILKISASFFFFSALIFCFFHKAYLIDRVNYILLFICTTILLVQDILLPGVTHSGQKTDSNA